MKNKNIVLLVGGISLLAACTSKVPQANTPKVKNDSVIAVKIDSSQHPKMNEEGLNIDYYNNGKEKMKGQIKDGKREGLWQAWYENGNLWSEAEYTKGVSNGKSITYFENGKIRFEGSYKNGNKTGVWKYYDENGNLQKIINRH